MISTLLGHLSTLLFPLVLVQLSKWCFVLSYNIYRAKSCFSFLRILHVVCGIWSTGIISIHVQIIIAWSYPTLLYHTLPYLPYHSLPYYPTLPYFFPTIPYHIITFFPTLPYVFHTLPNSSLLRPTLSYLTTLADLTLRSPSFTLHALPYPTWLNLTLPIGSFSGWVSLQCCLLELKTRW